MLYYQLGNNALMARSNKECWLEGIAVNWNTGMRSAVGLLVLMVIGFVAGCGTEGNSTSGDAVSTESPQAGTEYYNSMGWDDQIRAAEQNSQKVATIAEANQNVPGSLKDKVREPTDILGAKRQGIYLAGADADNGAVPTVTIVYSNRMTFEIRGVSVPQNYGAMVDSLNDLEQKGYGKHSTLVFLTKVGDNEAIALEPGKNQSTGGADEGYPGYVKWQADGVEYAVFGNFPVTELMRVANSV